MSLIRFGRRCRGVAFFASVAVVLLASVLFGVAGAFAFGGTWLLAGVSGFLAAFGSGFDFGFGFDAALVGEGAALSFGAALVLFVAAAFAGLVTAGAFFLSL